MASVGVPDPGPIAVTNMYGIEEETYKLIVKDIKLKLMTSITGILALPKTRDEYLKQFKNMFNNIDKSVNTFNSIKQANIIADNVLATFKQKIENKEVITLIDDADIDNLSKNSAFKEDIKYIDHTMSSNKDEIQNRIDSCYLLEGLYLRKHNELIQMFNFAKLLYNKFNYTLKLLLYVLSLLTDHKCNSTVDNSVLTHGRHRLHSGLSGFNDRLSDRLSVIPHSRDGGEHVVESFTSEPFSIKIPKKIIPNIKTLIDEQKKMLSAITEADTALKSSPLKYDNTTHKTTVKTPLEAATETGILDAINLAKI